MNTTALNTIQSFISGLTPLQAVLGLIALIGILCWLFGEPQPSSKPPEEKEV
jgi:hypothetical protein